MDGTDSTEDLSDTTVAVDDENTIPLLASGEIEVLGRMPWSSNGTYLVHIGDGADHTRAVYKPQAGERPLWDFPAGLWRREVATYELATALGWPVVPPTIVRHDAPLGVGSLQWFVPADFEQHYFTLHTEARHRRRLQQICLLDLVANNTDRKSGHVLLGLDGKVWAIDNGLSFHEDFKIRTVLWDFAGEPIDAELADALGRLVTDGLPGVFDDLLDRDEREATLRRARALLSGGEFPVDPSGSRYPWPLV